MKQTLSEKLLSMFGDIKYFRFPFFLVYDPGSYKLKGEDVREVIELIQPGDILVRAYTMYLDGLFIPGLFSHAAFYYGDLTEDLRSKAGERVADPGRRKLAQGEFFKPGKQMIIHSMAEGVFVEDILTFTRCDKLAVIRLPEVVRKQEGAKPLRIPERYITEDERRLVEKLNAGQAVPRDEVVALAKAEAVRNIGRPYDFDFDFANFGKMSCSELVYFCYKSIANVINVAPVERRFLFLRKKLIEPDAFLTANLECAWASRSVRDKLMELGHLKPSAAVKALPVRAAS
jgi:hypothetical protein